MKWTSKYLISIDTITFSKIARSTTGAVVGTSGGNALGFRDDQCHFVGLQLVIIDGQKPATGVQVLDQAYVHEHRFRYTSLESRPVRHAVLFVTQRHGFLNDTPFYSARMKEKSRHFKCAHKSRCVYQ